ncbi:unnamed protein product [Angiostrongylus costaricensis]|uniref:DUF3719 domain-containing protein n=1 Tax=Angiostrongylus costaricensis TaxID=334426 RepID=A0A158PGG6_ANGCS|nr:unnamed protein product [Angiostrongylus costaricensis]
MQRLHCWLDQLTLRRGRNRDANVNRRITSQSLTPIYRVTLESKNKHKLKPTKTSSQASPSSKNSQEPRNAMLSVPNLVVSAPFMARKPETGSFARRRGIRTNPWLYGGDSLLRNSAYHHTESLPPQAQCLERRCAPPTLLGVKSLEESTCSSGYGSQDCSPDSSIHMPSWQTTDCSNAFIDEPFDEGSLLEETSSFSTYDNICDASEEHIYHELESCFRVAEESCSSTPLSSLGDSRSDSPLCGRHGSPIYAQPWTHYHVEREHYRSNMSVLAKRSPSTKALTVRNQSFRRVLPEIRYNEYARPFHGRPLMNCLGRTNSFAYPEPSSSWVHRTENYRQMNENNRLVENHAMEDAEEEFLSELDAQIAELQVGENVYFNMS